VVAFRSATLVSRFSETRLIDVNCEFQSGSITCITSGATEEARLIFAALLGEIRPISGKVLVDGLSASDAAPRTKRRLTLVPSSAPLLGHLTTIEHVRYLGILADCRAPHSEVVEALRMCEVPDRLHHVLVDRLSLLHRLLIWVAAQRIRKSAVFLLEDPAAGLISKQAGLVAELLKENCGPTQTCIVTSRDSEFAQRIADRSFRISRQRLE